MKETADATQSGEHNKRDQLQAVRQEIHSVLQPATYPIEMLMAGQLGNLTPEQTQALKTVQDALQRAVSLVTADPASTTTGEPAGK
jgi:hypothetical protein